MADYIFTTDADDEAAIARWIEKNPANGGFTVQQVLRRVLRNWLTLLLSDWREERRTQLKDAYEAASPEDKAALDLILDKYR
jgi:hypothetical protein